MREVDIMAILKATFLLLLSAQIIKIQAEEKVKEKSIDELMKEEGLQPTKEGESSTGNDHMHDKFVEKEEKKKTSVYGVDGSKCKAKSGPCKNAQGQVIDENSPNVVVIEGVSKWSVCEKKCKEMGNVTVDFRIEDFTGGCHYRRGSRGNRRTGAKPTPHLCLYHKEKTIEPEKKDKDRMHRCLNLVNCGDVPEVVEGDIYRSPYVDETIRQGEEKIKAAEEGRDVEKKVSVFEAIKYESMKWPKKGNIVEVAYEYHPNFSELGRRRVKHAIEEFKTKTCVHWVPRTNEREYVYFYHGRGCMSDIGKIGIRRGGKQMLTLHKNCLRDPGTAIHEMMHAMGWFHEQSRGDRDKYVEIYWQNIKRGFASQFKKYQEHSVGYGIPYDTESVMHYGNTEFGARGRDGKKTTIVNRLKPSKALGNRQGLSKLDIKRIKAHYGLLETCNVAGSSGSSQQTNQQSNQQSNQQTRQQTRPQQSRQQESRQHQGRADTGRNVLEVSSDRRREAYRGQRQIIGRYAKQSGYKNGAPVYKQEGRNVFIMKSIRRYWIITGDPAGRSFYAYAPRNTGDDPTQRAEWRVYYNRDWPVDISLKIREGSVGPGGADVAEDPDDPVSDAADAGDRPGTEPAEENIEPGEAGTVPECPGDGFPFCSYLKQTCNYNWVKENCKQTCGTAPCVRPAISGAAEPSNETKKMMMKNKVIPKCVYEDRKKLCQKWAQRGECYVKKFYIGMMKNCPKACGYCQ